MKILKIIGGVALSIVVLIGAVVAYAFVTGKFNPKPIEMTSLSFERTGFTALEDFYMTINYLPNDANNLNVNLKIENGQKAISLQSNKVTAGVPFKISLKKDAYGNNIGGNVEISATSGLRKAAQNLQFWVDIKIPKDNGLLIAFDSHTQLLAKGKAFHAYVYTNPRLAIYPDDRVQGNLLNEKYKNIVLTSSNPNSLNVVEISNQNEKYGYGYFDPGYKTRSNQNGELIPFSNVRTAYHTEYIRYTKFLIVPNNPSDTDIVLTAKSLPTYEMEKDFAKIPNRNAENYFSELTSFLQKYSEYLKADTRQYKQNNVVLFETANAFIESITNEDGVVSVEPNQPTTDLNIDATMFYAFVEHKQVFEINAASVSGIQTTEDLVKFKLHDVANSEYTISMLKNKFKLKLLTDDPSIPESVMDGRISSVKITPLKTELDNNGEPIRDGGTGLLVYREFETEDDDEFEVINPVNPSVANPIWKIIATNPRKNEKMGYALKFTIGEMGSEYYSITSIDIEFNIDDANIILNTSLIPDTMVLNSELSETEAKITPSSYVLNQNSYSLASPTSPYQMVKWFAISDSIMTENGFFKIQLQRDYSAQWENGVKSLTFHNHPDLVHAYEIEYGSTPSNIVLQPLNVSDNSPIRIFAAVIKTGYDGNPILIGGNYVLMSMSEIKDIDITNYVENLNYYTYNEDSKQLTKRNNTETFNEISLLTNYDYKIFVTNAELKPYYDPNNPDGAVDFTFDNENPKYNKNLNTEDDPILSSVYVDYETNLRHAMRKNLYGDASFVQDIDFIIDVSNHDELDLLQFKVPDTEHDENIRKYNKYIYYISNDIVELNISVLSRGSTSSVVENESLPSYKFSLKAEYNDGKVDIVNNAITTLNVNYLSLDINKINANYGYSILVNETLEEHSSQLTSNFSQNPIKIIASSSNDIIDWKLANNEGTASEKSIMKYFSVSPEFAANNIYLTDGFYKQSTNVGAYNPIFENKYLYVHVGTGNGNYVKDETNTTNMLSVGSGDDVEIKSYVPDGVGDYDDTVAYTVNSLGFIVLYDYFAKDYDYISSSYKYGEGVYSGLQNQYIQVSSEGDEYMGGDYVLDPSENKYTKVQLGQGTHQFVTIRQDGYAEKLVNVKYIGTEFAGQQVYLFANGVDTHGVSLYQEVEEGEGDYLKVYADSTYQENYADFNRYYIKDPENKGQYSYAGIGYYSTVLDFSYKYDSFITDYIDQLENINNGIIKYEWISSDTSYFKFEENTNTTTPTFELLRGTDDGKEIIITLKISLYPDENGVYLQEVTKQYKVILKQEVPSNHFYSLKEDINGDNYLVKNSEAYKYTQEIIGGSSMNLYEELPEDIEVYDAIGGNPVDESEYRPSRLLDVHVHSNASIFGSLIFEIDTSTETPPLYFLDKSGKKTYSTTATLVGRNYELFVYSDNITGSKDVSIKVTTPFDTVDPFIYYITVVGNIKVEYKNTSTANLVVDATENKSLMNSNEEIYFESTMLYEGQELYLPMSFEMSQELNSNDYANIILDSNKKFNVSPFDINALSNVGHVLTGNNKTTKMEFATAIEVYQLLQQRNVKIKAYYYVPTMDNYGNYIFVATDNIHNGKLIYVGGTSDSRYYYYLTYDEDDKVVVDEHGVPIQNIYNLDANYPLQFVFEKREFIPNLNIYDTIIIKPIVEVERGTFNPEDKENLFEFLSGVNYDLSSSVYVNIAKNNSSFINILDKQNKLILDANLVQEDEDAQTGDYHVYDLGRLYEKYLAFEITDNDISSQEMQLLNPRLYFDNGVLKLTTDPVNFDAEINVVVYGIEGTEGARRQLFEVVFTIKNSVEYHVNTNNFETLGTYSKTINSTTDSITGHTISDINKVKTDDENQKYINFTQKQISLYNSANANINNNVINLLGGNENNYIDLMANTSASFVIYTFDETLNEFVEYNSPTPIISLEWIIKNGQKELVLTILRAVNSTQYFNIEFYFDEFDIVADYYFEIVPSVKLEANYPIFDQVDEKYEYVTNGTSVNLHGNFINTNRRIEISYNGEKYKLALIDNKLVFENVNSETDTIIVNPLGGIEATSIPWFTYRLLNNLKQYEQTSTYVDGTFPRSSTSTVNNGIITFKNISANIEKYVRVELFTGAYIDYKFILQPNKSVETVEFKDKNNNTINATNNPLQISANSEFVLSEYIVKSQGFDKTIIIKYSGNNLLVNKGNGFIPVTPSTLIKESDTLKFKDVTIDTNVVLKVYLSSFMAGDNALDFNIKLLPNFVLSINKSIVPAGVGVNIFNEIINDGQKLEIDSNKRGIFDLTTTIGLENIISVKVSKINNVDNAAVYIAKVDGKYVLNYPNISAQQTLTIEFVVSFEDGLNYTVSRDIKVAPNANFNISYEQGKNYREVVVSPVTTMSNAELRITDYSALKDLYGNNIVVNTNNVSAIKYSLVTDVKGTTALTTFPSFIPFGISSNGVIYYGKVNANKDIFVKMQVEWSNGASYFEVYHLRFMPNYQSTTIIYKDNDNTVTSLNVYAGTKYKLKLNEPSKFLESVDPSKSIEVSTMQAGGNTLNGLLLINNIDSNQYILSRVNDEYFIEFKHVLPSNNFVQLPIYVDLTGVNTHALITDAEKVDYYNTGQYIRFVINNSVFNYSIKSNYTNSQSNPIVIDFAKQNYTYVGYNKGNFVYVSQGNSYVDEYGVTQIVEDSGYYKTQAMQGDYSLLDVNQFDLFELFDLVFNDPSLNINNSDIDEATYINRTLIKNIFVYNVTVGKDSINISSNGIANFLPIHKEKDIKIDVSLYTANNIQKSIHIRMVSGGQLIVKTNEQGENTSNNRIVLDLNASTSSLDLQNLIVYGLVYEPAKTLTTYVEGDNTVAYAHVGVGYGQYKQNFTEDENGLYVLIESEYVLYDSENPDHEDEDRFTLTYVADAQGDYIKVLGSSQVVVDKYTYVFTKNTNNEISQIILLNLNKNGIKYTTNDTDIVSINNSILTPSKYYVVDDGNGNINDYRNVDINVVQDDYILKLFIKVLPVRVKFTVSIDDANNIITSITNSDNVVVNENFVMTYSIENGSYYNNWLDVANKKITPKLDEITEKLTLILKVTATLNINNVVSTLTSIVEKEYTPTVEITIDSTKTTITNHTVLDDTYTILSVKDVISTNAFDKDGQATLVLYTANADINDTLVLQNATSQVVEFEEDENTGFFKIELSKSMYENYKFAFVADRLVTNKIVTINMSITANVGSKSLSYDKNIQFILNANMGLENVDSSYIVNYNAGVEKDDYIEFVVNGQDGDEFVKRGGGTIVARYIDSAITGSGTVQVEFVVDSSGKLIMRLFNYDTITYHMISVDIVLVFDNVDLITERTTITINH